MKVVIFNGSPRKHGNTSELTKQIQMRFAEHDVEVEEIMLFVKNILGCNHCGSCQKARLPNHCSIDDDMVPLYDKFLEADLVIFASPIYMWQFTPCTIAFLNRLHCLCESTDFSYNEMANVKVAAAITLGDAEVETKYALGGLKDMCDYFSMRYVGDVIVPFADKEKIAAGNYAMEIESFVSSVIE